MDVGPRLQTFKFITTPYNKFTKSSACDMDVITATIKPSKGDHPEIIESVSLKIFLAEWALIGLFRFPYYLKISSEVSYERLFG